MSREPLTWGEVQPRYAAYCIAHGAETPQEMLERDTAAYPGGKMGGFILYIHSQIRDWRKERGYHSEHRLTENDHVDFSDWLLTDAVRRKISDGLSFSFYEAPSEVNDKPALVRASPTGGDPHVLAILGRVHRPDALHALCGLANAALAMDSLSNPGSAPAISQTPP